MTQNEKDLLIKDLCMRLPYGVKAEILNEENERKQVVVSYGNICYIPELGNWWWKECKPYLFPLSSMTDDQKQELNRLSEKECKIIEDVVNNPIPSNVGFPVVVHYMVDWCNKNHFDYRGLIPMGLANDATGLNIY